MYYRDECSECGCDYISGEYVYGDDWYIDDEYMEERWWYIDGIPDYMISDRGRVWSVYSQKFLKVKPLDNHGHLGVCMSVDGRPVYKYIHRLMARAFIPNPYNLPVVRHLDDNPRNNYLDNLRWGTQKDNYEDCRRNGHARYVTPEAREIGLSKMRTPVVAVNLNTGERVLFRGQGDAARGLGLSQSNIWKVLSGERRHTGGFYFEYADRGVNSDVD